MPTTNHTSRAPNRKNRAADSQLIFADVDRMTLNFAPVLPWGRPDGIRITITNSTINSTAAIANKVALYLKFPSRAAPMKNSMPLFVFFFQAEDGIRGF